MPAVKFFERLDLEPIYLLLDVRKSKQGHSWRERQTTTLPQLRIHSKQIIKTDETKT
jgi:hypothetical protein